MTRLEFKGGRGDDGERPSPFVQICTATLAVVFLAMLPSMVEALLGR